MTCEAHPYSFQVTESRRLLTLLLVQSRTVAELGLHHQHCNLFFCSPRGMPQDAVSTYHRNSVDLPNPVISKICSLEVRFHARQSPKSKCKRTRQVAEIVHLSTDDSASVNR
ncbi:hypothetical protein Taro_029873 [Colocasia esculenta]|uniref:Uncharacterized protein n=1 Tax=Colocasia esculenta TaxID=4460 RepID=A0A843VSF8_COLES|nr:hypothetical protein [Colocasia esculenta]